MRLLQDVLLIVGSAALGLVAGFFGLALLAGAMARPGQEPWQTGFGQYLGGLFCGAPLGTLVGILAAVSWIRARERHTAWDAFIWLGILAGLAAGAILMTRLAIYRGFGRWGTAVFAAGSATLGGVVGSILSATVGTNRRGRR